MRSQRKISIAKRRVSRHDWRRTIAAAVLVFFTFQTFITQTHVHLLPVGTAPAAELKQQPAPDKQSPADNPANCPICQDIALAGHFTTPAIIPVPPPPLTALFAAAGFAAQGFVSAVSHSWHGRAPPQD